MARRNLRRTPEFGVRRHLLKHFGCMKSPATWDAAALAAALLRSRRVSQRVAHFATRHALNHVIKNPVTSVYSSLDTRSTIEEARVFHHKMQADYYGYIVEFKTDDAKKTAAECARKAYYDAFNAAACLPVTHPMRLGLALNFSWFQYRVLGNPAEACKMAGSAVHLADVELALRADNVCSHNYREAKLVMQRLVLLLEQVTVWEN